MSDFHKLVERARHDLSGRVPPEPAPPQANSEDVESLIREHEAFQARLRGILSRLEGSLESFDLESDIPRTRFKRVLVAIFNRMLSLGGLAKHLGSTQKRANTATLEALRLLQERIEDQDRALMAMRKAVEAVARQSAPPRS